MRTAVQLARRWAWAVTVLSACGCNAPVADYSELNLSQVSGVVTLDGQPLANAKVRFYAPDGIAFSAGTTDAMGRYVLAYSSEQAGVTTGEKLVRITTAGGGEDDEDGGGEDEGGPPPPVERVPAKYNSSSELKVTVNQPTQEFNFDLQSTL